MASDRSADHAASLLGRFNDTAPRSDLFLANGVRLTDGDCPIASNDQHSNAGTFPCPAGAALLCA